MDKFPLIIAALVGLVVSCVINLDQSTHPEDWAIAEQRCQANGGLKHYSTDIAEVEVTCENGAVFYFDRGYLNKENK